MRKLHQTLTPSMNGLYSIAFAAVSLFISMSFFGMLTMGLKIRGLTQEFNTLAFQIETAIGFIPILLFFLYLKWRLVNVRIKTEKELLMGYVWGLVAFMAIIVIRLALDTSLRPFTWEGVFWFFMTIFATVVAPGIVMIVADWLFFRKYKRAS